MIVLMTLLKIKHINITSHLHSSEGVFVGAYKKHACIHYAIKITKLYMIPLCLHVFYMQNR